MYVQSGDTDYASGEKHEVKPYHILPFVTIFSEQEFIDHSIIKLQNVHPCRSNAFEPLEQVILM
jgi:hypothetical protein